MAYNTKINLTDNKVFQNDGQVLTLSGSTIIDTNTTGFKVGNVATDTFLGINNYGVIEHPEEIESRTIYFATTGDDTTGDGSTGAPYATLLRALQSIKTIINSGVTITIQASAGTYNFTWKPIEKEFSRFIGMNFSSIIINGGMTQLTSGFTLTADNPNAYIYNSTATWSENEYQDKFLNVGASYYPIASNTTNSLKTFVGLGAGTSIHEPNVIFNISDRRINVGFKYSAGFQGNIEISQIVLNISGGGASIATSNVSFDIVECTLNVLTLQIVRAFYSGSLYNTNVISTSDNTLAQNSSKLQLRQAMIRKSGLRGGNGITYGAAFKQSNYEGSVYIINVTTGIVTQYGNVTFGLGLSTPVGCSIIDATTTISIRNNMALIFVNHPLYLDGTPTTLITNNETPQGNYYVNISSLIGTPSAYLSSALNSLGYYDSERNIGIYIGGVNTATIYSGINSLNVSGATGFSGIEYSDDYSGDYIDRSLVDKGYVDSQISGISGVTCADNGLSLSGNTVVLGGTLTGDTTICLNEYNLNFDGNCGCVSFGWDYGIKSFNADTSYGGFYTETGCTEVYYQDGEFGINNTGAYYCDFSSIPEGIRYADDYGTTLSCLSLVHAGYVTGLTSTLQSAADIAVTGATNGLCKYDAHNICLGGLLTSTAIIADANFCSSFEFGVDYLYALYCDTNPGFTWLDVSAGNFRIGTSSGASAQEAATISLRNDGPSYMTFVGGAHICVYNNNTFQYDADYSANYNCLSLVHAGYVTGVTSSAITSAENGLTASGQVVKLGGALTGNTIINLTGNTLIISDTNASYEFTDSTIDFYAGVNGTSINLDGSALDNVGMYSSGGGYVLVDGVGDTAELVSNSGAQVVVDGGSNWVALTGDLKLETTPAAGSATTDAVLVWNSSDNLVKQVNVSNLGEENNRYSVDIVTTNITLPTSGYTILVSGATSVTLPAGVDGMAFKIKDAAGSALTTPITVVGTIDGDTNTTINTDYGALELVYSSTLGGWFSLAFIN